MTTEDAIKVISFIRPFFFTRSFRPTEGRTRWTNRDLFSLRFMYFFPICLHALFHLSRWTCGELKFTVSAFAVVSSVKRCIVFFCPPLPSTPRDTFIHAQLFIVYALRKIRREREREKERERERTRSRALLFVTSAQTNENNSCSRRYRAI